MSGLNVTADSFYSSQSMFHFIHLDKITDRIDTNFDDHNASVLASLEVRYPSVRTLEMETFLLFHLSTCSKIPIHASSAAIVV